MVEIQSRCRQMKVYSLTCGIPLKGAKAEAVKGKKYMRVAKERALTLQAWEKRSGLPDAILACPQIEHALAKGLIRVKRSKPKAVAAPKSKAEAKPTAASKRKNTEKAEG